LHVPPARNAWAGISYIDHFTIVTLVVARKARAAICLIRMRRIDHAH
jgi:hypothetical protein